MALSEAKKAADKRHIAKLDVIKIQPYKEEGAAIRAAAAAAGKSVQGYVLEAVREKMERERAGAVPGDVPAGSSPHTMPEWGSKEYFEAIKAEAKQKERGQQQGTPTIGSSEWWAERRPKQPQEGAGDDGSSTGEQFPYFPDDGDTPPAAVGSSPMRSEESSPAEQIFPDLEEDDGELPF